MGKFERLFHLRLWRPGVDEGIDWEIRHHIEERMDELRSSGMSEDDARAEAQRALGDEVVLRRTLRRIDRGQRRSERGREFAATVWQDARYGARGLARNAGFAAAVVLTLALGIGANGALFSVADALLLRPLPFAAPNELVQVMQVRPQQEFGQPYINPELAREWRAEQSAVPSAFLHYRVNATYLSGAEPASLPGLVVSDGFAETLGVQPAMGRSLAAEDMVRGAPAVVLLSWDFWTRALGAEPGVVGTGIELNGEHHTVIGVMPRGFKYPLYTTTDFWLPLYDDNLYASRPIPYVGIVARVSGGEFAGAEAAVSAQAVSLIRRERPDSEVKWRLEAVSETRARSPELRQSLKLLTGAVVLILLIAGVNMVNLLLLRGAARTREIAVRLALGASRGRLVRQLGTEAMLLALLSGIVATLFAFGALRVLQHIMPSALVFFAPHAIELESRTLLFTFCLALVSGFVFGLLPALRATRLAAADAGGGLTPHTSSQPVGSAALRHVLVTSEVALSVTLLVGAGLLISSFVRLNQVEPGMDLHRLAVLDITINRQDYATPESRAAYLRLLEERIGALPGVEATALTGGLPPRGGGLSFPSVLEPEGGEPRPYSEPLPTTAAGPDFFRVTGAQLVAGRPFHSSESYESHVVIIDEDLAAHLWPGRSAVGRRFRTGENDPWQTVVGVMADLKLSGPDDRYGQFALAHPLGAYEGIASTVMAIRTVGDPRHVLQDVRAAVHATNPRQVITGLETGTALFAEAIDMQRFLYIVITTLAALALALTAIGMYGLLAYGVARRHHEIGVRLALGARGIDVRRVILGEALGLTAVGAAIGAAGAVGLSRFIEATLFGVQPVDPTTYAVVGAVIFTVAVLASVLPAHRAARVDPAVVLRSD